MKLGPPPIVWSDRHRPYEPGGEVWIGVRTPGTEVPRRAGAIPDALRASDAPFVDARPHPDDDVVAVHDPALPRAEGSGEAGRIIGAMSLPTVLVQEGGYDLTTTGALVAATLAR